MIVVMNLIWETKERLDCCIEIKWRDYLVEGYPLSMTVIRFSPRDVFVQGRLVQDDGLKIEKKTRGNCVLVPFNYETRHRRQAMSWIKMAQGHAYQDTITLYRNYLRLFIERKEGREKGGRDMLETNGEQIELNYPALNTKWVLYCRHNCLTSLRYTKARSHNKKLTREQSLRKPFRNVFQFLLLATSFDINLQPL